MSYSQVCIKALKDNLYKLDEEIRRLSEERTTIIGAIELFENKTTSTKKKYSDLSQKEAIIQYLSEQNRGVSIAEIVNALIEGGIESKAGRFSGNIHTILRDTKLFKKENKLWRLNYD